MWESRKGQEGQQGWAVQRAEGSGQRILALWSLKPPHPSHYTESFILLLLYLPLCSVLARETAWSHRKSSIRASYSHPCPQQLCSLASPKYIKIYEILRAMLQNSTFILRTKYRAKCNPQPLGCWPASSLPGAPAHVPPTVSPSSLFIAFQLQDFPLTR